MAVMPALAWEPGDPLTPYHLHSFIHIDHILTPDTATLCHDHYQPRHLPHVIVGFDYDHYGDFARPGYTYVDLLQDTAVCDGPSFELRDKDRAAPRDGTLVLASKS